MSEVVEVKITGLDELQKTLEELPLKMGRRVLRKSLEESGEIMKEEMVNLAPEALASSTVGKKFPGFLKEHFGVHVTVHHGDLAAAAYVGPLSKTYYPYEGDIKQIKVATGKYAKSGGAIPVSSVARFLEFGTSKMSPHPFMVPAYEGSKGRIMDKMVEDIKEALEEATK